MAEWGAFFNHPDGARQFDSESPCMCRRAKGVVNAGNAEQFTPPGIIGFYYRAKVTYTGSSPQIAFRPTNCNVAITSMERSGNSYTYTFRVFLYSAGWQIEWWIFDLPPSDSSAGGWGIMFWDAAGRVTFNSDYPPMKMVRAIDTAKKHAVVSATGPSYRERVEQDVDTFGNPITTWFTSHGGYERTGETITIRRIDTFDHYYSTSDITYDPSFITVDVTNL